MEPINLQNSGNLPYELDMHRNQFEQFQSPHRRKRKLPKQQLQPWMENFEANPFLSFRTEIYKKLPQPTIKRQGSLIIDKSWKYQQKDIKMRQSKKLPVMDIGELNQIRKSVYPIKIKSKLELASPAKSESKRKGNSEVTLPSVQRQLSLERKIFLMKNINTNPQYSKHSKIRTIIGKAIF